MQTMRGVSPSVTLGLFLSVFILFALAQGELYAVVHNRNVKTNPVQTARVNAVGEIKTITTSDESGASHGISAFDQNRGIYYFARNAKPVKILATDVKNNVALQPIILSDVDSFSHFHYDNVNDRLLLFYEINNEKTLASYQDGKLQDLWKVPRNLDIISVGLDEATQRLFMVTTIGNAPPTFAVYDLVAQQSKGFSLSPACQAHTFHGRIVWSPKQQKAYVFTTAPHPNTDLVLNNYVTVFDLETESCESILIHVPFGFVTDCAIDTLEDKIHFTQMINMGDLYFVYDIRSQVAHSAAVMSPSNVEPMGLAVGPSYSECSMGIDLC